MDIPRFYFFLIFQILTLWFSSKPWVLSQEIWGYKASFNKSFLQFLRLLAYHHAEKALQNIEKSSKMPKIWWQKMKKTLVQRALKTHISSASHPKLETQGLGTPLSSVTTINITSSLRSYKVNLIKEKRNKVFSSSSTSSLIEAAKAAASNLSI